MTPEELRRMATELDEQAKAALKAGNKDEWEVLQRRSWYVSDMADEREHMVKGKGLPTGKGLPSGNNPRMIPEKKVTTSQLKRRGAAVARGWAAKTGSPVAAAITASKYKSLTRYAKERLKISQPALSRYISGGLPCPRFVADAIKADFGIDHRVWSRVVD